MHVVTSDKLRPNLLPDPGDNNDITQNFGEVLDIKFMVVHNEICVIFSLDVR